MRKKKTSKKRDSSFKNMSLMKLRPGVKTYPSNASETLRDQAFIARALIECLQDGDVEAFKEILGAHLEVINKSQFSAKTKIPERTLYRMISEKGNPTLENIARIVHALCA